MSLPKSVMRINKKGMQFTSSVDRVNFTIKELNRAALKDVGKMLKYKMRKKYNLLPGMSKSSKRFKSMFQSWVRTRDADLQIGMGNSKKGTTGDAWYGIQQELGSKNQPKKAIMKSTVMESLDDIKIIEGKYISKINEENLLEQLIDIAECLE